MCRSGGQLQTMYFVVYLADLLGQKHNSDWILLLLYVNIMVLTT